MADITKCANSDKCPNKDYCYRNIANASDWQSYMNFYKDGEICKDYIEMDGVKHERK